MNKIKMLLALLLGLSPLFAYAQDSYITQRGKTHYQGKLSIQELYQDTFADWRLDNSDFIQMDKKITAELKDYKVQIFIGTWCGDSKKWVPEFLNLWKNSGLQEEQLELIALNNEGDMYKRSTEEFEKGLNIHRVPTFIFRKNGKEKARIVERPMNDLKTDITQIALNVPSKPRYRAVAILDKEMNKKPIDTLYTKGNYQPILRKAYREVSNSGELNTYGYVLKAAGELRKAEFAFFVNRNLFRTNPNTWDSLGEIYFEQGKYKEAKSNYEKVLELDPESENAKEMLNKIADKLLAIK